MSAMKSYRRGIKGMIDKCISDSLGNILNRADFTPHDEWNSVAIRQPINSHPLTHVDVAIMRQNTIGN